MWEQWVSSVAFLKAPLGERCPVDQGSLTAVLTSIDLLGETHVLAMGKGKGHVHLRRTLGHHLYM